MKRGVVAVLLVLALTCGLGVGIVCAAEKTSVAAPSDVTATSYATEIILNWKDNASNESGFEIERKVEGGSYKKIDKVGESITIFTDSGLATETKYYYRIRAYKDSTFSDYSKEVSASTKKAGADESIKTPASLKAEDKSGTEIVLSWTDSSDNETGFIVERKTGSLEFAEVGTVKANITTFNDNGLQSETKYIYRVKAVNAKGESPYSDEASAKTQAKVSPKIIVFHIGNTTYTVNGVVNQMDVAPVIINNRCYLPVRYVAEPLGATVSWDQASSTVKVVLAPNTIEMQVGNHIARVNGVDTPITDDPQITPIISSNRLLVPMSFLANGLGCETTWDAQKQEITVAYPKPSKI